jgi:hypothetical protein
MPPPAKHSISGVSPGGDALTGSPQQHMNLGLDWADRPLAPDHAHRLKLLCDVSFNELLTNRTVAAPQGGD